MEEIIEAMFESARTAASCRRATGTEDVQSAKSQVEIILGELVRTLQKNPGARFEFAELVAED